MKNILIPTDFSVAAWNAVKYTIQLFHETECVFHFINAFTPELHSNRLMAGSVSATSNTCTAQLASEKGLRKTIAQVKKAHKNPLHRYRSISTFSMLVDEIKEVIALRQIDYVIMSASGGADDESIFFGRNTVRILNHVHECPVLVIPSHVEFEPLHTISVVSEYNHVFGDKELTPVVKLAKNFNSTVHIASLPVAVPQIVEIQELNHKVIDKKLGAIGHKFYRLDTGSSLTTSLKSYMDHANCQLLVMSNNANSYLRSICNEFIVGRSTFCCHMPMLSLQLVENNISISP